MNRKIYGSFFKVTSFNFLIFGLLTYFTYKGWLFFIFSEDKSYISLMISIFTVITTLYLNFVSYKVNVLQEYINENKIDEFENNIFKNLPQENRTAENLYMLLFSKIYFSKQISLIATLMGLLGTVLGFIFVLIFVDFSLLKDSQNIQKVLESISVGMGVALYTTLVGTFCSLWVYILFILMNFDINNLCFKYSLLKKFNNNKLD